MNINTIKAFSWLVSAGITAGLGYYVWEFRKNEQRILGPSLSAEETKQILSSAVIPEGPKSSLVEIDAIRRSFYYNLNDPSLPNVLDWSGARVKKVVVAPPPEVKPQAKPRQKISELLSVQMVRESTRNAERREGWIKYKPKSEVKLKQDTFLSRVRVGDALSKPLEYITVKAISANEGVTFSFDEEGREDETVTYARFDSGVEIRVVDKDNPVIVGTRSEVPKIDIDTFRPERSTLVGEGIIRLGSEDIKDFGDDFGGILAREAKYRRHYNPKTKKYDGVELTSVAPGGRIAAHGGQSGDIIKSINGQAVSSSSEAISFVKNNKDVYSKWVVVIENKGKERTMTFESPPSDE